MATEDGNLTVDAVSCSWRGYEPAEVAAMEVLIVSSLVFVLVGVLGNVCSVLVFRCSPELRRMSSCTYLCVLAVSDSCYLLSVLLSTTVPGVACLLNQHILDLFNHTHTGCKLIQYLMDLFADYSKCVILLFTLERCLLLCQPATNTRVLTISSARRTCLVLFIVIAVSILPYHVMHIGLFERMCGILHQTEALFAKLYIAEITVFRILPVFAIAILNAIIVFRLCQCRQCRQQQQQQQHSVVSSRAVRYQEPGLPLTAILVLVSGTYILTYLPVMICFILKTLQRWRYIAMSPHDLTIFGVYSSALYICGFAINVFFYTLSSRVFRDKLRALVLFRTAAAASPRDLGHVANGNTSYTELPLQPITGCRTDTGSQGQYHQ